eukprot:4572550-Pleurochrysis_carterae.AAC.1
MSGPTGSGRRHTTTPVTKRQAREWAFLAMSRGCVRVLAFLQARVDVACVNAWRVRVCGHARMRVRYLRAHSTPCSCLGAHAVKLHRACTESARAHRQRSGAQMSMRLPECACVRACMHQCECVSGSRAPCTRLLTARARDHVRGAEDEQAACCCRACTQNRNDRWLVVCGNSKTRMVYQSAQDA